MFEWLSRTVFHRNRIRARIFTRKVLSGLDCLWWLRNLFVSIEGTKATRLILAAIAPSFIYFGRLYAYACISIKKNNRLERFTRNRQIFRLHRGPRMITNTRIMILLRRVAKILWSSLEEKSKRFRTVSNKNSSETPPTRRDIFFFSSTELEMRPAVSKSTWFKHFQLRTSLILSTIRAIHARTQLCILKIQQNGYLVDGSTSHISLRMLIPKLQSHCDTFCCVRVCNNIGKTPLDDEWNSQYGRIKNKRSRQNENSNNTTIMAMVIKLAAPDTGV